MEGSGGLRVLPVPVKARVASGHGARLAAAAEREVAAGQSPAPRPCPTPWRPAACWWPQVALAARYGVRRSLINRLAAGESWAWVDPAAGDFDAFIIKGRRAESGNAAWRVVGCEVTVAEAWRRMVDLRPAWQELRLLHHRTVLDGSGGSAHLAEALASHLPSTAAPAQILF